MLQVISCELTAASFCSLRLQQLSSNFLLLLAQMVVCATTAAQRWSSLLEGATLGAWPSISPGRRIRQTPLSSSTTSQMQPCSPMQNRVILHLTKPNKEWPHNDINMCSLPHTHTDVKNSSVKPLITGIGLNTCYSCKSDEVFKDALVNQTMWNVLIQAFVANNKTSDKRKCEPRCKHHLSSLL